MTWWRVPRDFVRVSGPDAQSFLQGQLSQDVDTLQPGSTRLSFLLQPNGKVDAFVRVSCIAQEAYLLDVDAGWGDAVVDRLQRFKLRTKADITRVGGWQCIAELQDGAVVEEIIDDIDVEGVPGDLEEYEVLRIKAGLPAMGNEIDDSTIPASLGQSVIDAAVSFTKGCYTGQELVARMDSREASAPTKLVGFVGAATPGDPVQIDGRDVGRVTSAAGGVALALVRRDVELPAGPLVALPMA
jgi:folate-binding protein YgfZ